MASDAVLAVKAADRRAGDVLPLPVAHTLSELADRGVLGAGFPTAHGGTGGDLWDAVALHEEVAQLGSSAVSTAVLSHLEVGTRLVLDHASPSTTERWVPPALRAEVVLGYAATEDGAGSDLAATTTTARRDGDSWVVDGSKKFISNGAQATALCVLARTGDQAVTSHSLLLVPLDADGVSTRPLDSLGNRGTLAEVRFDAVRVSAENLLGLEGQGLLLQIRRLAHERAFVAVMLHALARGVLDDVVHRVRGTGKRAWTMRVTELVADAEAAGCLARHAIALLVDGRDCRSAAAMAKLTAARLFRDVAAAATELDPADAALTQIYRDALGFAFAGGTEHMLLETIAR